MPIDLPTTVAALAKTRPWPNVCKFGYLAIACILIACVSLTSAARTAHGDDPVHSGREALREVGDLPWYDAQADDLRSVTVQPPPAPPGHADVEERLGSSASNGEGDSTSDDGGGNVRVTYFGGVLQALALTLLGTLLVVGMMFLIRAMLGGRSPDALPDDGRRLRSSQVDRMEQLPVPLRRAEGDLLAETRRQYEAGNYNEAIIYLYSYLLVELDKVQRIRLLRGKTNRQYLWELRQRPPLRELVEQTMVAFEDVFFGGHDLDRARFEACYHRLDEFHRDLEAVAA